MSVQVSINNKILAFILAGLAVSRTDAVITQDAGRTTPLLFGTLMSKTAATQEWVPFIDETDVTGAALPQGIYIGADIAAADLVAGDVTDTSILVGSAVVDLNQIVIENSKTLDTVIGATTVEARTVRDQLAYRGIFAEDTVTISNFEN